MAAQHKHRKQTHRKPGRRPLGGKAAARAATALALTGAATAGVLGQSAAAAPSGDPDRVQARVESLYREAEAAADKYHGAKEQAKEARKALDRLQDEAARRTQRLNSARTALGSVAKDQYREGTLGPVARLALSEDPAHWLRGAELAERAGDRQSATLAEARGELRELDRLRDESARLAGRLTTRERDLARNKRTVQGKLREARHLLARLTADERARLREKEQRASRDAERSAPVAAPVAQALPGSRAAAAIAYAYRALGKPYVWGATGPSSYDCSGLTLAAYRAAGVSLPRTSYSQINAGQRVSRGQLRPGDLVFFYSGVSHVGLYIGDGKMIHAPKPGAPVRVAPIDQMPFAGAARVA
ncbi:C40 family peptidase [Streptomyces sp. NA04227]|uniref:C40 family peptidase n=1 Tax=Streptomyces sp. NA04227 TaxID=2742136 RepID=UPI00158FCC08|nr:C40 family peptidase [Streptomyces sp. NA04227]QKW08689.1 C40 family peptidase [Streptomyces sp. NA04227]